MDRLYVGFLIGFVLGVWVSFIVVMIAARSTRRNQPPPSSTTPSQSQQEYRAEPENVTSKPDAAASSPTAPPRPPATYREAAQANPKTHELFHKLLGMNTGDEAVTNRLIDYERQRAPRAPLEVWIQNAIDRLAQDRR